MIDLSGVGDRGTQAQSLWTQQIQADQCGSAMFGRSPLT
jgi:hypothetical protein